MHLLGQQGGGASGGCEGCLVNGGPEGEVYRMRPPMDLANMRRNGVRSLYVWCLDCGHEATVNVDDQPGHLAVPSFAAKMKCSQCGGRRVSVRAAWKTKPPYVPPR